MKSIIQHFTRNSWFRRGPLQVQSYRCYPVKGKYVKEPLELKTYYRRFVVHSATDEDLQNAGLGEIENHSIVLHLEFPLNFGDGKSVTYTLDDGTAVEGVTVSDVVIWQGARYKLIHYGPWYPWRHWYYIAEKIQQDEDATA